MRQLNSILFLLFLLFYSHSLYSQNDNVGSGRAVSFNGTTDYVDFGDRYSDLKFPFTVSAWIYLRPSTSSSPIFVSRNNNPLYSGFWFMAYENYIFIEYGDGFGGNNPAFRRGKKADVTGLLNRWNHVTAVVKGLSNIELYLNGVNIGGYTTGDSPYPMVSNISGGHSTAAYLLSNGFTYKNNGMLDDIRLWNRALSQNEIRQTMCVNLQGNEPGLIGYWDFNETSGNTIFDKSPNHFNGQFVGNPQRVFSGAAIGDVSTYSYSTSWSGTTVSHQDNDHRLEVKNINGNVSGVQIYEVKSVPSQTTGLDLNNSNKPYFGVFLVSQYSGITFDAEYSFQGNETCGLFLRDDNSKSLWVKAGNPVLQKSERGEIVLESVNKTVNLDLGVDKILCDQSSYSIATGITDPQLTFQWSTGQNTPSIQVSQSGLYSVKVFGTCSVVEDTIRIDFKETPQPVSLGNDKIVCDQSSYEISTGVTDPQFTFQWNTGQTTPSIQVSQSNLYWVNVSGICGVVKDTVRIDFKEKAKPVFLGDDKILCDQSSYEISTGITDPEFTFQWNTGQTTSSLQVNQSNLYWVEVSGICGVVKDSVRIDFKESPKPLSLGNDKIICDQSSYQISTGIIDPQLSFQWSTGESTSSISVNQTGLYSVKVIGYCEVVSDTILLSFEQKPKVSLGEDKIVCDQLSYTISTQILNSQYTYQWNTGQTTSSILASQSGSYAVKVMGYCGMAKDSVVIDFKESPKFFLGDDKTLCDNTAAVISTGITDDQLTFQWNTGQTTSFISVNETGLYSAKVVGYCGAFQDSIKINFEEKPEPFSLGEDRELCVFEPSTLQPLSDSEGLTFLWQDGSTDPLFKADSFGEFWVMVKNSCGEESDTIRFSKKIHSTSELPNVITPNGDTKNDYFVVDDEITGLVSLQVLNRWGSEVYYSSAYLNKWDGEDLSSGVYYIVLEGPCIEQRKGLITIMR